VRVDEELWARWIDGDEQAGADLFRRHFLAIHRFFTSKLRDIADELTQRTFLAAVESRARVVGPCSVRAYLFGIARKQLLRHLEGRGVRIGDDASLHTSIFEIEPSPSDVAAVIESRDRVRVALRKIPLDHQIAIELHFWEGLTVAEIAVALEIPEGTVKSRLSRAKDALREVLARMPGIQTL